MYLQTKTTANWNLDLRLWWIDPLIATLCFAFSINVYSFYERKHGTSSCRTWSEYVAYDTKDSPVLKSLISYIIGIRLWKLIVPPPANQIPDGLPSDFKTVLYLILEVSSGIICYDAIFFFIHWSMHVIPFLRHIHHNHHSHKRVEARDVLRHSILDGTLQVFVNIIVQRHTPWGSVKSRLARAFHNLLVTWMLTESHTSSPYPNIFRKYCIGVRNHRFHHSGDSGKIHRYQQFFGYLDNALHKLNIEKDR